MSYTGLKQAEYGLLNLVGAPQEYVNTYSTPRTLTQLGSEKDPRELHTSKEKPIPSQTQGAANPASQSDAAVRSRIGRAGDFG